MRKAFVITFILFICVFGFLPKTVETAVYIIFVISSAGYIILHPNTFRVLFQQNQDTWKLRKMFLYFLAISILFFFLSFLNLPKLWGIKGLPFRWSYIPRHYIIIVELFMPVCLGYFLQINHVFNRIRTLPLLLAFVLLFFGVRALCVKGLLLILLVLASWKAEKKVLLLPAFFIFYEQSAYVLGYFALLFVVCFEKTITSYLYKNTVRKIIILTSLAVVLLFLASGFLAYYIENDANSLWRLRVWINEVGTLAQTYFTGVGFGSAYVTEDIVYMVDNSNMYMDSDGSIETGLFVVANHSSLVNMFYRMGLIGGALFIAMNIQLVKIVVRSYRDGNKRQKALLWRLFAVWVYETIIIFLNPGLEMMQFAISYLLSVSFLLAIIWDIQNRPPKEAY